MTTHSSLKKDVICHIKYKCETCGKCCKNASVLNRHKKIHDKPFECILCDNRFADKSGLKYHQMIHTGEKTFQCNTCDKYFTRKDTLTAHLAIHSGQDDPWGYHSRKKKNLLLPKISLECKICQKTFPQKKRLAEHEKIHASEKLFQCNYCPKRFSRKSTLWAHERLHTKEGTRQCSQCDNIFTTKHNLTERPAKPQTISKGHITDFGETWLVRPTHVLG